MSMIEPAIEKMSEKVGNKYKLVTLVSKRARQIQKRNIRDEEINPKQKEISEALDEVATNKLIVEGEE